MGEWLSTPESWIRAAAVLIGIAVVLLVVAAVVGWRSRRRARRQTLPDAGPRRLLAALVADPDAALVALGKDDEPCTTAIELLRAGVPAGGVARLTGIDVAELGDVVAARLGVLEPS